MKIRTIIRIVLAMLFVGCAATENQPIASSDVLTLERGQVWQLVEQRGKEMPRQGNVTILEFVPDAGSLRGRTGCNRYFAEYKIRLEQATVDGTRYSFTVKKLSPGDWQCPEGDMEAERRYISLLEHADAMMLTAQTMTLYRRGKEVLKYELQ